ncbi:MAG: hypothetical protein H5T96_09220, partial [Tissierellales bacterium]|nr:hypothetical protein [Tissierellales bacterium]
LSCIQVAGFKEENIHVLLYSPKGRPVPEKWDELKRVYPKLNIFVYEDKGVQQYLGIYIPVLRPHLLWQHFQKFPELELETIVYTDCDILWTEQLDIEKYFDDNVCYISDARSYLNYDYFKSKRSQVIPDKLEEYDKRDILQEVCDIVGVDKQIVIDNNSNTGGVQYILKGMTAEFWKKVEKDVIAIRVHLMNNVNKTFFKNENVGFQSWCADLWAVLYNLWYYDKEVKVVKEMDFAWASDPIERLGKVGIFHNAGVVSDSFNGLPAFYKGKYHTGNSPIDDPHLQEILNNEQSKKWCTWWYTKKLYDLYEKYKINY